VTNAVYRRSPRALSRDLDESVLVVSAAGDEVHELHGGAASVWTELDAPTTAHELVERIASTHGVDRAEIAESVDACLARLLTLEVIEVTDGSR
jgi:Coenzyme PQQ synthesis protein D (PqqD)